jgi:hypothetical protein
MLEEGADAEESATTVVVAIVCKESSKEANVD